MIRVPGDNWWNASPTDDGTLILGGKSVVNTFNPDTGEVSSYTVMSPAFAPTYQGGWGDPRVFLRQVAIGASGSSDLEWLNVDTGVVGLAFPSLPPTGMVQAGPDLHWVASCGNGHGYDLFIDGKFVTNDAGRPCAISLTPDGKSAVMCTFNWPGGGIGLRLYVDGTKIREWQAQNAPDTVDFCEFRYPNFCYGLGKPHILNVLTDVDVYVGVFPAHGESCASRTANECVWTLGQVSGKVYLCGRFVGVTRGIVLLTDVQKGGTCSVVQKPNGDYRALVNEGGTLWVYDIPKTSPLSPIPVEPPPPEMADVTGVLIVDSVGPLTATAHFAPNPGSGQVSAIRFLTDGAISQPADNLLTHTYALTIGPHTLGIRGQALNGHAFAAPGVQVTVPGVTPVPVPPTPPPAQVFWHGLTTGLVGWQQEILDRKINLGRFDCLPPGTNILNIAAFCKAWAFTPLYLCTLAQMSLVPEGSMVELWNNSGGSTTIDPITYAKDACSALDVAKRRNLTLFVGCCDNMNDAWLKDWMPKMIAAMGSRWAEVLFTSIHWYADDGAQTPTIGHNGRTKQQDVALWLSLIGSRKWMVTECGYSTWTIKTKGWWFFGWHGQQDLTLTEQMQYTRMRYEVGFWPAQQGCIGLVGYQLICAPPGSDNSRDNWYGWVQPASADGQGPHRWKLVGNVWM